jgi:hypothetical protein
MRRLVLGTCPIDGVVMVPSRSREERDGIPRTHPAVR